MVSLLCAAGRPKGINFEHNNTMIILIQFFSSKLKPFLYHTARSIGTHIGHWIFSKSNTKKYIIQAVVRYLSASKQRGYVFHIIRQKK